MEVLDLVCDHCDKLIFRNYNYSDHCKSMSEFNGFCAAIIKGCTRYEMHLCPDCVNKYENHIIKFLDHEVRCDEDE